MSLEERLAKAVKSHRFLYDKSHKLYKNKDLKDRTWKKIASQLNMPENKVVARWRTLRDRYKREKKSVSSSNERATPGYKFAKVLSFLDDVGIEESFNASESYDMKKEANSSSTDPLTSKKGHNSSRSQSNSPTQVNSPSNSEIYVTEKDANDSTMSQNNSPEREASPDPLLLNDLIEIDYGYEENEKTGTPITNNTAGAIHPHPTSRASSSIKPTRHAYMKDARKEVNQIFEMAKQCLAPQSGIMAFFHSMGLQAEAANFPPDLSLSLQQAVLKTLERHISMHNARTWYRK